MKIEDEVEFAYVPEVLVQNFNKSLHELEDDEFVFFLVDDGDEVETGVSFVYDFVFLIVEEIAHLGVTSDDQLVHLR